jgi:hypothetical protein
MKLENWQLLLIAVGVFAGIVVLDVIIKMQGDENFKVSFPSLPKAKFAKSIAPQLQAEEQNALPFIEAVEEPDAES